MISPQKALLEKRIVTVLVVIFIIGLVNMKRRISTTLESKTPEWGSVAGTAGTGIRCAPLERKEIAYTGRSFRDPLKKPLDVAMLEGKGAVWVGVETPISPRDRKAMATIPGSPAMKRESFLLEGIIWGGKQNIAIISGKVVAVGEMINSAKVISIEEDEVVLEKGAKEIKLVR